MASFAETHGPLNAGIELNRQEAGLHETALGGLEIAGGAATSLVIASDTAQAAQTLVTEGLEATESHVAGIADALAIIIGHLKGIETDMQHVADSDNQVKSGIEVATDAMQSLKNTVGSDGTVIAAENNARERAYDASQIFTRVAGNQPPAPLSYAHYSQVRDATTTELPALSSQVHTVDEVVAPLTAVGESARQDHDVISSEATALYQAIAPLQEAVMHLKGLCAKSVGESALLSAGLVATWASAGSIPPGIAQATSIIGESLAPGAEEVHQQAVDALERFS